MRTVSLGSLIPLKTSGNFSGPPFSEIILSVPKMRSVWWEKTKGLLRGKEKVLYGSHTEEQHYFIDGTGA